MNKPWTSRDDEILRARYVAARTTGTAKDLANELGRTPQFLSRKARAAGLSDRKQKKPWMRHPEPEDEIIRLNHHQLNNKELAGLLGLSVSGVEKRIAALGLRKDPKAVWRLSQHPRGMLGKKHSPETATAMRDRTKKMWADPNSKVNSQEHRQKLSDRMSAMQSRGVVRNAYSRCSAGHRADLGMYFRSSWEANYARYLNWQKSLGFIVSWEYEVDTFWFEKIKRGTRSYKPDFKIKELCRSYYVEVKGWMDAKSKTKLARMALYYPGVEVRVVGSKEYKEIARKVSAFIPFWERPRMYSAPIVKR